MEHSRIASLMAALTLIIVMALSTLTPAFNIIALSSADRASMTSVDPTSKIDKALLSDDVYSLYKGFEGLDEALAGISWKLKPIASLGEDLARVTIYYTGGQEALSAIKDTVTRVTSAFNPGGIGVAFALATKDEIMKLAELPFVIRIEPQKSILETLNPIKDFEGAMSAALLGAEGSEEGYPIYSAPMILGADRVWSEYGITGSGVKVGVVDTGVDLGSPDLGADKIARADDGTPLLFDADMVGFVYTGNPTVRVDDTHIYIPGWFNGYIIGFLPILGGFMADYSAWVYAYNFLTGVDYYTEVPIVNTTMTIPEGINGSINFGLAYQLYYVYGLHYGVLAFTLVAAPTIIVDTEGDGLYDTVYVDLSTTYYLFLEAMHNISLGAVPEPDLALLDLSFADEPAIRYGSEVAARDFTGDGVTDFSMGALAGAVYDYWGLFTEPVYRDWLSDWEPSSLVVPGIDTYNGLWVDFVYDFHGHGTSVAHVIAAKGEVERPVEGHVDSWTTTMPGIAPGALIGGAPALFNGDVVVAQLWLAGFDMVDVETFTWVYTGQHQVDIISNSWGSSWLLFNGYASDADPMGLWQNYIVATSGTVIVHAAGNGGPGWGTVTMPGASTLLITVAATTDFYYRPYYGFGGTNVSYIPGGHHQVISWSDRGPTQFGYPKPDVSNIGSFEWAGGKTVDGVTDGRYAFDLFGGTSEATPMTSGVVALIIQALREAGIDYTPSLVKAILKSTADDMGYNPYAQGSGHVNAYDAVKTILEGGYIAYSKDSVHEVLKLFDETMAAMLGTTTSYLHDTLFAGVFDTAIYPGPMIPGQTKTVSLEIAPVGPAAPTEAKISDYALVKTLTQPLSVALDVEAGSVVYSSEGEFMVEPASQYFTEDLTGKIFVNVSETWPGFRAAIPISDEALKHDFIVLDIAFPMFYAFAPDPYDPYGRVDLSAQTLFLGFELGVWFDLNGDGMINAYNDRYYEVARIQYDIREGPVAHLELGKPMEQIMTAAKAVSEYTGFDVEYLVEHAKLVLEIRVLGNAYYNTSVPPMPLYGSLTAYDATDCLLVSGYPETLSLNGSTTIDVTISVPEDMPAGIYEAYLVIEAGGEQILVPVSVPIAKVVDPSKVFAILMSSGQPFVYDNYNFRGALDQGWRPETGDWRVYPIAVPADKSLYASSVKVRVSWSSMYSDYDAALIGPGVNYWGTVDWSFATYIDAAVLGGKLTYPYLYLARVGVYQYFDYPSPGVASFTAPLDSLRPLFTGEDYTFYWLVVHQKFSDQYREKPFISMFFGKMIGGYTISLSQGTTVDVMKIYLDVESGYTELLGVYVLPLEGQASPVSVANLTWSLGSGMAKIYRLRVDATTADTGTYLVMLPTMSYAGTVVMGLTLYGGTYVLYYQPLIYTVPLIVNVT